MSRRDFIAGLAGGALATSAARAQQPDRVRRIGVLMSLDEKDPEGAPRVAALRGALQELGWTEGRDIHFDYRWVAGENGRFEEPAAELLKLSPDILVVSSTASVLAVQQQTRGVPVVFLHIADPVGRGFVESIAHPGGNITGFTLFEGPMAGKWLQMLKEAAPRTVRVTTVGEAGSTASGTYSGPLEAAAPALGIEIAHARVRDPAELEEAVTSRVRAPFGGLVVLPSPFTATHRDVIIDIAARHRLPAVYPFRYFATSGGLMSYGLDSVDLYRRSATYVDRILRGAKPGDLPVQLPVKFELAINLKTAKALDLVVPPSLPARADEVIE